MINSKHFFLNGQKYATNADLTIFEMIQYFSYHTSLLVLEYNRQICKKEDWKQISIKNNDKVEIVTIVGGG